MKNIPLPRVVIIAIALMVVVVATAGIVRWVHPHHTQPTKVATLTAQTAISKPTFPPAPTANSAGPNDAQMQLAIAHKGEGVENTLIRQFAADPATYGFTGKQDDVKAVHRWAARQAHLLAIKAGYYDWKFGAEVRVASPDKMAFVIQKDAAGNLTVVEYAVTPTAVSASTTTPTFSQETTHASSTTIGASDFFGASPTTGNKLPVPHGEYVYFPGE